MSEIYAKRAVVKVRKQDKYGKPYIGQQDAIVSQGIMTAKTAEKEAQLAADEARKGGEDVVGIEVETYDSNSSHNPPAAWAPLMDRVSSEGSFAGFSGPGAFPPDSPMIRRIQERSRSQRGASPESS